MLTGAGIVVILAVSLRLLFIKLRMCSKCSNRCGVNLPAAMHASVPKTGEDSSAGTLERSRRRYRSMCARGCTGSTIGEPTTLSPVMPYRYTLRDGVRLPSLSIVTEPAGSS